MFRSAVFFFIAMAMFALVGFWPRYFSDVSQADDVRLHFHGVAMSLWCLMLITQAALARSNLWQIHRAAGKASYLLAPVMVVSTLSLMRLRLRQSGAEPPVDLGYFIYVQLILIAFFALSYTLAMVHRKKGQLHARYMICTAVTPLDPIFSRVVYIFWGIDWPWAQVITYGMIDAILLALFLADLRKGRYRIFGRMLGLFAALQVPTFFIYRLPAWRSFTLWFRGS